MTAAAVARESYLRAIEHLPPGAHLRLHRVPWETYEALLEDLGPGYAPRISYDCGRLEVEMPLPIHELVRDFLSHMLRALTDVLEMELECLGSTTFRYQPWTQGLEPDGCYYIQNAARIRGVKRFDPQTPPPPPDIAVEIDITNESLGRFPIYQNLGVPEIWRCDEHRMEMYHLTESGYVKAETSRAFPFLTGATLFQHLERSQTEGQSATLRAFREWVKTQTPA
jgi:Uma2 family endonuclease